MERAPRSVSPDDLVAVIESFGFEKDRQSGSHVIYRHPATGSKIAFAHRRPTLDAAYVKEAIRVLRSMEGE